MLQAPFLFQSNLPWNGKFQLIPRAKYIGANEGGFHQAAEFYELGFSSLYLVPLDWSAENKYAAKAGIDVSARAYTGHDPNEFDDRNDARLIPTTGLRIIWALRQPLQLDIDYAYDHNFSNDRDKRFRDHIIAATTTLRF